MTGSHTLEGGLFEAPFLMSEIRRNNMEPGIYADTKAEGLAPVADL